MSKKKEQQQLQVEINNDEEWDELLHRPGLWVIDVYRDWSGPCICAQNTLKKIKLEMTDDLLNFALAACDNIKALEAFRYTCEPQWLFMAGGEIVGIMKGADVSKLSRMIFKELEKERNVLEGKQTRSVISDLSDILKPTRLDLGNPAEEEEEKEYGLRMLRAVAKVQFTAKALTNRQYTLALIKPDAVQSGKLPEILQTLKDNYIEVLYQQERILTEDEVKVMYKTLAEESFFPQLVTFMTSGPSVVLVLARQHDHGESIITEWKTLLGPPDATKAKEEAPDSLRAKFGAEGFANALHGSDNEDHASTEVNFFFPKLGEQMQRYKQVLDEQVMLEYCVIVVRPATFQKFTKGDIVDMFAKEGIQVIAKRRINFTEDLAESLYSYVSGPAQESLIKTTIGGPSLAVVVTGNEIIKQITNLLGPESLKDARSKYSSSWRAVYTPQDQVESGFYMSRGLSDAKKDLSLLFPHLHEEFSKLHKKQSEQIIMTKVKLGQKIQHAVIVVLPHTLQKYKNKILMKTIENTGMYIFSYKILSLTRDMAQDFFSDWIEKPEFNHLIDSVLSGPCLLLCVIAEDIIQLLKDALGPVSVAKAKEFAPDSLRSLFSSLQDDISPMYASESEIAAKNHLKLFFQEIHEQILNITTGNIPRYCVVIISPNVLAAHSIEKIEKAFFQDNLPFICEKFTSLTESQAEHLYKNFKTTTDYTNTVEAVTSSDAWIIGVYTSNVDDKLKTSLTSGSLSTFKQPTDNISFRISNSPKAALEEMEAIFPNEVTFGIIKPDAYPEHEEKILKMIVDFGLQIASEHVVHLTPYQVTEFYASKKDEHFFGDFLNYMCSGKVKLLALRGHGAVRAWRRLMGPTDPELAKKTSPFSIRALFGTNIMMNAVHGSGAPEEASRKMTMAMSGTDLIDSEVPHVDMVFTIHTIYTYKPVQFILFLIQLNTDRKSTKEFSYNKGSLIENWTKYWTKYFFHYFISLKHSCLGSVNDLIIAPVQIFPTKDERKNNLEVTECSHGMKHTQEKVKDYHNPDSFPIHKEKEFRVVRPENQFSSSTNQFELQKYLLKYNFSACLNKTEWNKAYPILPLETNKVANAKIYHIEEKKQKLKPNLGEKSSIPIHNRLENLKKQRNALIRILASNVKEIDRIEKHAKELKSKMISFQSSQCLDAKLTENNKLYISLLDSVRKKLDIHSHLEKQRKLFLFTPAEDYGRINASTQTVDLEHKTIRHGSFYETNEHNMTAELVNNSMEEAIDKANQMRKYTEKNCHIECLSETKCQTECNTEKNNCHIECLSETKECQTEYNTEKNNYHIECLSETKECQTECNTEKNNYHIECLSETKECQTECNTEKNNYHIECLSETKECQTEKKLYEEKNSQTEKKLFEEKNSQTEKKLFEEKNSQTEFYAKDKMNQTDFNLHENCQTKYNKDNKSCQTEHNDGQMIKIFDEKYCQTEIFSAVDSKTDVDIACEIMHELQSKLVEMMNMFQESKNNHSFNSIATIETMRLEVIDAIYDTIITAKVGIDSKALRRYISEMFITSENANNSLSDNLLLRNKSLTKISIKDHPCAISLQESDDYKFPSHSFNSMALLPSENMVHSSNLRQAAGKEFVRDHKIEESAQEHLTKNIITGKKCISSPLLYHRKDDQNKSEEQSEEQQISEKETDLESNISETVISMICSGAFDAFMCELSLSLKEYYLNEEQDLKN